MLGAVILASNAESRLRSLMAAAWRGPVLSKSSKLFLDVVAELGAESESLMMRGYRPGQVLARLCPAGFFFPSSH